MCHLILFLPAFALPLFWIFPLGVAGPTYAFITGISFLLYYKIFHAMRLGVRTGYEAMLGKKGVVVEEIDPEGKIRYAGEIWNAAAERKRFSKGDLVRIGGLRGLTLLVEETPDREEPRRVKTCH